LKQTFELGEVHKAEEGRTITFVANFWQDKKDKEKIWMVSNGILAPTEVNNHPTSVNHHPKLFNRLKAILEAEGRWLRENNEVDKIGM
jgi:hypothetical protein